MTDTAFWVRVPASTSNLGPGGDVLGLALDRFLELRFAPSEEDFRVLREGTLTELSAEPGEDLVLRALLDALGLNPMGERDLGHSVLQSLPGGTLMAHSTIPVGRGLGSSAAARVAGYILGQLLAGAEPSREEALAYAAAREGHPDNAAPAVLGGLVAARLDPRGQVDAVPIPLSSTLAWVYAEPGVPLSTQEARAALPGSVDHGAAVRNAGRLALLIPALAQGDGPLLALAMEDELHAPYRLPLIPGGGRALEAAREAGAWAATLSGAGSGVIAVCPPESTRGVAAAMKSAFQEAPGAGAVDAFVVHPWLPGAQWGRGAPPPVTGAGSGPP